MAEAGQDRIKVSKKPHIQKAIEEEKRAITGMFPGVKEEVVNRYARDRVAAKIGGERLKKEVEEHRKRSVEDLLTGLLNRRGFDQQLERILLLEERQGRPFSLLILDLDAMKYTNDNYGHAAGDELLRKAARLIEGEIRKSDIAGRIGGDEFAIILTGATQIYAEKISDGIKRAFETKLLGQMSHIMRGIDFPLTISIGLTTYPEMARTAEQLMHQADTALYESKRPSNGEKGKNRVTVFTGEIPIEYRTAISEPEGH